MLVVAVAVEVLDSIKPLAVVLVALLVVARVEREVHSIFLRSP